jgi:tetratricopeptide (TPR) repeat protein
MVPVTEMDPYREFPEKYRGLALESEERTELRKALLLWQVVLSFEPNDREASEKIANLREQIRTECDKHFQQGVALAKNHSVQAARKEFLIVLTYDPDHAQAAHYLKYELTEPDFILYETKSNDTLKKIAKKVYNDSEKDFLIAYFNDLNDNEKFKKGVKLKIPVIEPLVTVEKTSPEDILKKAETLITARKYEEAISLAHQILEYDPANSDANEVLNLAYYSQGKVYLEQQEYQQALRIFKKIGKNYKDTGNIIKTLENHTRTEAEIHFRKGVQHFLDEELAEAIKEWEVTLHLDPEHSKAREEIEKTRRIIENLKKFQ